MSSPMPYTPMNNVIALRGQQPADIDPTAAPDPTDVDAPDVGQLCKWFEESETLTYDARRNSERARDYYNGDQWTAAEMAILKKRGQPALTINYIKRKVEYLRGFERRMRSDPKAFPRNPDDDQLSEAATDALRYVADRNNFDVIRSDVYEDMLVEGYGGVDVTVEEAHDGIEVVFTRIPWDRIWYDPFSREKDFSDATRMGIVIWMDKSEALEAYPGYDEVIESTLSSNSLSETYDDRPRFGAWADNQRTRIRIVQAQFKWKGQWMIATYTRGGFLTEPMVSPYVDREGKPACSLKLRSAYIDRQNNRFGHVDDLISLQDEVNKRRSKLLHLLSVRQTFGNQQAIRDVSEAKRQMAKPDGHIEILNAGVYGQDFGIIPTGDMSSGQMEMLQHATGELQATGANQTMAGKDPRVLSGKAMTVQQAGGQVEIEPIIDDLRQWTKQVYEAAWLRVRQFWTEGKWIRVTDDQKNAKWVGLNQPVTLSQALGQLDPAEAAQYAQQMQLQPNDPRLDQVVRVDNDIAGLDVDITIDEGPELATTQQEQFEMLGTLAQSGMPIPPEVIIQASSLRNKDQLIEMLKQSQQGQAQQAQVAQQAAQQKQQVDNGLTVAKTNHANAQAAHAIAEAQRGDPIPAQEASDEEMINGGSQAYLQQLKTAAEIHKLQAQAGQAQAGAIKTIADAQRPPRPQDYE